MTETKALPAPNQALQAIQPTWSGYDLEPVWGASDASDARQLMSVLESAGFKAYLGPENLESVEDYRGSYEDGVEITVMKFQVQFAIAALRRFAARAPDPDPSDDVEYAVFCPSCNSRDVVFRGVDVEPGKEPGPDAKYNWTCEACGHQWKDDGIEKVA